MEQNSERLQLMNLETDFYQILNQFQDVYVKYHDQIIVQPISQDNSENLSKLAEGLKNLAESFNCIPEAYKELCACKGIEL